MKANSTGKLIQELRINAGFTQKALAAALHITDKAVSKWERDICLPDVSLLPNLALLLDIDVELLITNSIKQEDWIGLIDIATCDFSQTVFDKPLVYYLLMHFLLLGIQRIHVLTLEENQSYLSKESFQSLGFHFSFDVPSEHRAMIINHPWFVFGSDLTQQFQGAMISGRDLKMMPENQPPIAYFAQKVDKYIENKNSFIQKCASRKLGRGMICLDMESDSKRLDVATFVRTYQENAGLMIGCLEEIAHRKGYITTEQMKAFSKELPYKE